MDLLVLAKEPLPGRVKTRLSPPCSATDAAAVAAAALADTLEAALASGADRVVLALDGEPGWWCPAGIDVVGQGSGDLAQRLSTAWGTTSGPALQIGMDTPQAGAHVLDDAMTRLLAGSAGAALGLATDGGWWALGMRRAHPRVFAGIPTSRPDTGAYQLKRLRHLGLGPAILPTLRDVDTWPDALAVAETAPQGQFAETVRTVAAQLAPCP